jgi:hypothetical protein
MVRSSLSNGIQRQRGTTRLRRWCIDVVKCCLQSLAPAMLDRMLKPQTQTRARLGRRSLFRDKLREPMVTITLTKAHHAKVRKAMRRLGLTRADLLGLLVETYADVVVLPPGHDGSPTEE